MSRKARGAPVKRRPKKDGMADAVIKTARLSLFLDLIFGPTCPQGQYAKQSTIDAPASGAACHLGNFSSR